MAALTLRVVSGDWGGAPERDIQAVAKSAVLQFASALPEDRQIAIVIQRSDRGCPWVSLTANDAGEYVVHLDVAGTYWAQVAYQFAHEFCHVLAGPTTWLPDRFAWLEEAICEAASLFALRRMAYIWTVSPPYPHWGDFAPSLQSYFSDHVFRPEHSLPADITFAAWFGARLTDLERNHCLRADNTIIAKALLPVFESHPLAWRAVHHLHRFGRDDAASVVSFCSRWRDACPTDVAPFVERVASVIGLTLGAATPSAAGL